MAVEKLSVSVPAEVAELIRSQAADAGLAVSAWLTAAAREKAAATIAAAEANTAADELLAEAEAAHGPATAAQRAWVTEVLASAGLTTRVAS
jgi:hypothetical protein